MNSEEAIQELVKFRDFEKSVPIFGKPKYIVDFIRFMEREEYPYPEYASWFFSHLTIKKPETLEKHYNKLVDIWIESPNHTLKRNLLKAIAQMPFKLHREGEFLDALIFSLADFDTKVAVKVYAMDMILHFMKLYPELKNEIKLIVEDQWKESTPAFKSRSKKFLKQMDEIK